MRENYDIKKAKKYFENYTTYSVGPIELLHWLDNQPETIQIVDFRTLADYEIAHIPTAIHIPEEYLVDNYDRLNIEKLIIVYCYNPTCQLAAKKAIELVSNGYKAIELLGGFQTWTKYRLRTERL